MNWILHSNFYSIYFCITGTVVGGPVGGVVATAVTATIIYEKERKLKEQKHLEQSNTKEQEEQAYS